MATKTIDIISSWSNLTASAPLESGKTYSIQVTRGDGAVIYEGAAAPPLLANGNFVDAGDFLPFALIYDGTTPWWIHSVGETATIALVEVE